MDEETTRPVSKLACRACKRRKVKCNRALPVCSLCISSGATCEYPTHQQRPGPKIGSTQKVRRRRTSGRVSRSRRASVADSSPVAGLREKQGRAWAGNNVCAPTGRLASSHTESSEARLQPGARGPADPTPIQQSPASVHNDEATSSAPTFSQIMYPSHEAQTRPQSPSPHESPPNPRAATEDVTVERICERLKIPRNTYVYLMDTYFAKMTSFTLFKPHDIELKFAHMRGVMEAEALVAAMFSFSARFHSDCRPSNRPAKCPEASYFVQIATTQCEASLDLYENSSPPLCLLQATVLVAFYQLTQSVRSKSWRILGHCIRLAYDMNLHLIDAPPNWNTDDDKERVDMERWSILEERRRAWWAIWEMDVFASTIRRLPMGIDWGQNFTFLPVPDTCWFNGLHQPSCYLATDPSLRWKHLSKSGNSSGRAWFIVVNSFMRNTQLIVYDGSPANDPTSESSQLDLTIIANSLFCTTSSLPPGLAYRGETLDFSTKDSPEDISCHQYHGDKYSIHLMTQLVRFMIHHNKICSQAPWLTQSGGEDSASSDLSSWSNYMNAAEEIVNIVRSSHCEHYKYVSPFLVNTLWFAAAAQIACRVFGPPVFYRALADSNYEVLALTIDRFITFWSSMDLLKSRLGRIEAGLKSLRARASQEVNRTQDRDSSEARMRTGSAAALATELEPRHPPIGADQLHTPLDVAAGFSFDPMLFDNTDTSGLGYEQLFFNGPGQFFPYGIDDLWMFNGTM